MSSQVFPTLPGLAWNNKKTPVWKTTIHESVTGMELRSSQITYPRYQIDLSFEVLRGGSFQEIQTLIGFFNQMRGAFDTFLWDDPDDNTVTNSQFGSGDGVTTSFQLNRSYGGFAEPILNLNGTPVIKVNGVIKTLGTDFTLNAGVVTFATAPASGLPITWTGQFYKRCRFLQDQTEFTVFMYQLWSAQKVQLITVKE